LSNQPIEFFFDFTCPYAYIASTRLEQFSVQAERSLELSPVLLGGLFQALDQPQNMSTTLSLPKAENNRKELVRWASWYNVPLRTPLRHPNRSVLALRTLLACPRDSWGAVMASFYAVYWAEAGDLSDPAALSARLDALGLRGERLVAEAGSPEIKAELRQRTDRASKLGVFGVPTFAVDGRLFWGQDRMEMAAAAATGWTPDPANMEQFGFNQTSNEAEK
jgi:2-hydroxychromene-2-carboxylate isomerase